MSLSKLLDVHENNAILTYIHVTSCVSVGDEMEALLKSMAPNARDNAKHYVANKEIPQLFEV